MTMKISEIKSMSVVFKEVDFYIKLKKNYYIPRDLVKVITSSYTLPMKLIYDIFHLYLLRGKYNRVALYENQFTLSISGCTHFMRSVHTL